jgi:hypothetical protein
MRRTARILLRSLVFIPWVATCGGEPTGPSAPVPYRLAFVAAPPGGAANGQSFGASVRLLSVTGVEVEEPGVAVTAELLEAGPTLAGGLSATTAEDGTASFANLTLTGLVGTYHVRFSSEGLQPVTATVVLGPGGPYLLEMVEGDGQSVRIGESPEHPLVVRVRDAAGNPLPNVIIRVTRITTPSSVGGLATVDRVTDVNGLLAVSDWYFGNTIKQYILRFVVPNAPSIPAVDFVATTVPGLPSQVTIVTDWPQAATIDTTFTTPFTATVKDFAGNPLPGWRVHFLFGDTRIMAADSMTDSLGRAVLPGFHAPLVNGSSSITALVVDGGVSASYPIHLWSGPPVRIEILGDSTFFTASGRSVQLRARLWDAHGNPADNKEVTWAVGSGPGRLGPRAGGTDGGGGAWADLVLDPGVAGRTVVHASAPAIPDSVAEFVVDAVAPVALIPIAGDSQRVAAGDTIPVPFRVRVVDSAGLGVAGVPVQFEEVTVGGVRVTDSAGEVEAAPIIVRTTLTPYALRATSPWITDSVVGWTVLPHAGPATTIVEECCGNTLTAEVGELVTPLRGVLLRDRLGLPVRTGVVHFTVQSGSVQSDSVVVDSVTGVARPVGWRLDTLAGEQHLIASYGALTPYHLKAVATAGPVAQLTAVPGHGVTGFVGEPVAYGLDVQARDRYGNPAAGRGWTPLNGAGGTTAGGIGTFDADGRAYAIAWVLGSIGNGNTVVITAGSDTLEVAAEGLAPSPFDIQLRGVPAQFQRRFRQAAFEWRRRIVGDIPNLNVSIPSGVCAPFQASVNGTVDDLIIDVSIGAIDGPGGILGGATPCIVRTTGGLPLLGWMQFDAADLTELEAEGTLGDVVLHEMGHVLGIGTLWEGFGLLSGAGSVDPRYTGAGGKTGFVEIGGAAGNVPVENTGGTGTRDSHWRESVMPSELMTGYLSALVNPMSLVTVRGLADFGYVVDLSRADAYTVMTAPMPAPGRPPRRVQDIVERPRFTVDPDGTVRPIE